MSPAMAVMPCPGAAKPAAMSVARSPKLAHRKQVHGYWLIF